MINKKLFHVTDIGVPHGNGVDSNVRITKQYHRLGVDVSIISAGDSPCHIAFAGCADLSPDAVKNANNTMLKLGLKIPELLPVSLNSAPRNSKTTQNNAKEDYIYRVKYTDKPAFLLYGPEVLKWVLVFCSRKWVQVEKILSITDIIPDTSCGSQFRSAQHLPIAHFLEAEGRLEANSEREDVDVSTIAEIFPNRDKNILVVPPDEYGNCRLVVDKTLAVKILAKGKIKIAGISSKALNTCESLTSVVPDKISIWPSSNYLPDPTLTVLNIGTRWKPGTTKTTNKEVLKLSQKFAKEVGKTYKIKV